LLRYDLSVIARLKRPFKATRRLSVGASANRRSCAFKWPKSTGFVMNPQALYSPVSRRRSSSL
jgi:hypothetical protein